MTKKELLKKLPWLFRAIEDFDYEPCEVLEHAFFRDPYHRSYKGDYRKQTIDACIKHKIPFTSSCNTVYEAANMFIKPLCPKCKRPMKCRGGGGSSSTMTMHYECSRHKSIEFNLTVPSKGIYITFGNR